MPTSGVACKPQAARLATRGPLAARSLGVALYAGAPYLAQVWLFWVAPIIGAVLGAAVYRFIGANEISQ